MIKFAKLHEYRFNPENGDIEVKLLTPDNKTYEASFTREMVPELLILFQRLLSATADQFPRGWKELVAAYIPKSLSVIVLPNGDPAIEFVTQTEMRVPIHLTKEIAEAIRASLVDADPILAVQPDQKPH